MRPVEAYLQPVHTITAGFNMNKYVSVELLDNDGNMYITYWDVKDINKHDFNLSIKECRKEIQFKRLFNKNRQVSEIKISDIKPSLFKPFNSCLLVKQYEHKSSDAFAPDKYKLTITRAISSSGEYMPVGAKYYIFKNGVKFKGILLDVKKCELVINKMRNQGISETYSGFYSHVSIEGYANSMTSCLRNNNYLLDLDKTQEPDKSVKHMREKDTDFDQANSVPGHLPQN